MAKIRALKWPDVYLTKLDRRSGHIFDDFKYRVDIYKYQSGIDFIKWAQENLGYFLPWNMYYCGKLEPGFVLPKWTVRYQAPGELKTEVFLNDDVVPYVMLHTK